MSAPPEPYTEAAALSLTMAVVASSPGPLVLLDGDLNVVAASASFTDAFGLDPATVAGRPFASLGGGEWNVPRLIGLLVATASGAAKIEAYELDFKRRGRPTRCLIIHAQRLVYLDLENHRLLLAISDVTDARADAKQKARLLQENLVLLQEVRHRVANSLQIIASVLLQNARRTQSDETRSHLKDAHNRVMSVAALERQLSDFGEGEVELKGYLTQLCESIAASVIGDRDHTSLVVTGAVGLLDARVSVSLGLIVTELVINALKHAFPDERSGKIVVDFSVDGPNWALSVTDDGGGIVRYSSMPRTGLGTSIVEALAKQLEAVVETTSSPATGTRVTIVHTGTGLTGGVGDPADGADVRSPA